MDIREALAFAKQCAQFAKEANVPFNLNFNLNFPFSLFSASDFSAMITPSVNPTSNVGRSSSSAATNKPECSEAPQSPVPRGRRIQYLFMDEYYHEDTKRTKQEAARVKQYVADHHWGQMRLDSKSTNRLNLMVACFWYYWHDRNWVPDIPQGAAIYRFVTEQCNMPCDVHPRAFMSAITRLINDHRKDPETYANLRTYFPQ